MLLENNTLGPYLNSVVVALGSTVLAVLIGSLAAYALVRIRFRVKLAAVAIFLLLLVGGHRRRRHLRRALAARRRGRRSRSSCSPSARIGRRTRARASATTTSSSGSSRTASCRRSSRCCRSTSCSSSCGLLDTRTALIATYTAVNLPIVVWLTRDFFAGIPIDLEESAELDGASKFRVFFTIALPLVRSGLVATFLLVLILAWNEYLLALFLSNANAQTMPVLVSAQNTTRGPQWWNMSVLIVVMIAPGRRHRQRPAEAHRPRPAGRRGQGLSRCR